jgi:hypothetical protein
MADFIGSLFNLLQDKEDRFFLISPYIFITEGGEDVLDSEEDVLDSEEDVLDSEEDVLDLLKSGTHNFKLSFHFVPGAQHWLPLQPLNAFHIFGVLEPDEDVIKFPLASIFGGGITISS